MILCHVNNNLFQPHRLLYEAQNYCQQKQKYCQHNALKIIMPSSLVYVGLPVFIKTIERLKIARRKNIRKSYDFGKLRLVD